MNLLKIKINFLRLQKWSAFHCEKNCIHTRSWSELQRAKSGRRGRFNLFIKFSLSLFRLTPKTIALAVQLKVMMAKTATKLIIGIVKQEVSRRVKERKVAMRDDLKLEIICDSDWKNSSKLTMRINPKWNIIQQSFPLFVSFHLQLRLRSDPLSRDNALFSSFFKISTWTAARSIAESAKDFRPRPHSTSHIVDKTSSERIFNGKNSEAMINLSVRDYWTMMVSARLGFECSLLFSLDCLQLIPAHTRYIAATREVESWNKQKEYFSFHEIFSFSNSIFQFLMQQWKNYSWQIIRVEFVGIFLTSI